MTFWEKVGDFFKNMWNNIANFFATIGPGGVIGIIVGVAVIVLIIIALANRNNSLGRSIGNVLWLILGGAEWGVAMLLVGVICCCTIIFIPVGIQYFKMGLFVLWPFGKDTAFTKPSGFKTILNVLWAIFAGWEFFLAYAATALIFTITIIGIPFGKIYWRIAKFMFLPLGRTFERIK